MNPYILLAFAVALCAAGAGGFKLGVDHEFASQAREDAHIAEAVDAANTASAQAISTLKPIYTTLQGKVTHEIETNVVYMDCKLSPDGLLLANQALSGGSASSGELPKADPAGK